MMQLTVPSVPDSRAFRLLVCFDERSCIRQYDSVLLEVMGGGGVELDVDGAGGEITTLPLIYPNRR